MSSMMPSGLLMVLLCTTVPRTAHATRANPGCSAAGGVDSLNMPGGDLPGSPHTLAEPEPALCAALCKHTSRCEVWTYHSPHCSGHGERKPAAAICYLKTSVASQPAGNPCTCTGAKGGKPLPPAPPPAPPPALPGNRDACPLTHRPAKPPKGAKNVLYILVDDLRPSLSPYGQTQVHTPNIQKLADSATVFLRAYCQEAVCSPSRNSFLSGRRPDHTRAWNFINHFRQADTGLEVPHSKVTGGFLRNISVPQSMGAAGECGTQCTTEPGCNSWSYTAGAQVCTLSSAPLSGENIERDIMSTAGRRGNLSKPCSMNWTSLPEMFRNQGYLTQGTGKIYHTEEGGSTGCWDGPGMPPNQDPISWTPNGSMFDVNAVAPMVGCAETVQTFQHGCADNATLNGEMLSPLAEGKRELCDKVILDDALAKLHKAAAAWKATGQPFFLASGFRKPHTPWRFPAPFLDYYNNNQTVDVALHGVLDKTVPDIAISSFDFQDPYVLMSKGSAMSNRLAYYAAVSWMDHQVGKLLDELESLGLADKTVVAFHADHGWSLGEHGQWQKFTNWEAGVRVPLIIRDPYIPQSHGQKSVALVPLHSISVIRFAVEPCIVLTADQEAYCVDQVELVDIMPTLAELAGVATPGDDEDKLDGVSLASLLHNPSLKMLPQRDWALSQYPRCPAPGTDPADYYKSNKCEFVERSAIPFMGYSLRTDAFRYTEWATWNGSLLRPEWDKLVGTELYAHDAQASCNGKPNACFDDYENVNLAVDPGHAADVQMLSKKLHDIVAAQYV